MKMIRRDLQAALPEIFKDGSVRSGEENFSHAGFNQREVVFKEITIMISATSRSRFPAR
jgi:hypothetical protein